MLFNSIVFLFFFLALHLVFWNIPGRFRKPWLLFGSILFYGYWSLAFLFHFLAIVALSYLAIVMLLRQRRRLWLLLGLGLNLVNLIFFKYTASLLEALGRDFGIESALALNEKLDLVLPLAISFYTFQIIAFIVDVWRGEVREITLLRFAVFIMFFPQLIAGPIMRHRDFLTQMDSPVLSEDNLARGLFLIIQGVIKKVLIADELAYLVNPVWENPSAYDQSSVILAVFAFVPQVYCDFSGYTDMARGQARLLGYRIPENFFAPYLASSFAEIWRRWHVTLSTWLRDYLYVPLGGNRVSAWRLYINILIVMVLGGIWHGNTLNFLIWGLIHAFFLITEKLLGFEKPPSRWQSALPRNLLVMVGWTIASTFFRAPDLATITAIVSSVSSAAGEMALNQGDKIIQLTLLTWALQFFQHYGYKYKEKLVLNWQRVVPALSVLLLYLLVRIERPAEEFIYFQF